MQALPPSSTFWSTSYRLRTISFASRAATCLVTLSAFATPALARHHRVVADSDFTKDGRPNVKSTTALVVDLNDGGVLYEKDPDVVRPLASLSKMMSALVIHEECKLNWDDLHEMTPSNREAAKGGDKTKLTTGWQFSHRDLLYAALMRSDNRALPALGEACGLSPEELGKKMTARARRLGLTKSFFKEPTGLSTENVSTAREVMAILKEVLKVPEITTIMETQDYEIVGHKNGLARNIKIHNTDRMLGKGVAEILGGKTGYTDPARYCLAIAARTQEKREVAMVFLGAEGRFTRFADFTRVIKWARVQDAKKDQNVAGAATLEIAEGFVTRVKSAAKKAITAPVANAAPGEGSAPLPQIVPTSGSGSSSGPVPASASGSDVPSAAKAPAEDDEVRTLTW